MNDLVKGSRVELRVDRLSLGGDAVGRVGNAVVFVPYGCPGDTLEVELTEVRSNFARGRLLRVIDPSPVRQTPPCPYHFTPGDPKLSCGGCSWQHIVYPFHLDAKQALVQETLERIGGVRDVEVRPTLGMSEPWRYRNKIQQPFGWDGGRLISGFYAPFSHDIVPIEDCLVQSELSVRIVNRARSLLAQFRLPPYDENRRRGWIRHLLVRTTQSGKSALLVFITRTDDFPHEAEILGSLVQEFPELVGIHQNVNPASTNVILGRYWRKCAGADYVEEHLGDLRFYLSPGSFFQVNTLQTVVLYDQVKGMAGRGDTLLDLYCGVGGMALWLANNFRQVIGVDDTDSAIRDAKENARLNNIRNTSFLSLPVERYLTDPGRRPSGNALTVLLDPPRAGCNPQVLSALGRLKPSFLIYVSCDPATLARDLVILQRTGFKINTVQPVDLFPHTPHIETIVHMNRPG